MLRGRRIRRLGRGNKLKAATARIQKLLPKIQAEQDWKIDPRLAAGKDVRAAVAALLTDSVDRKRGKLDLAVAAVNVQIDAGDIGSVG